MPYELIDNAIFDTVADLISGARREIKIISPFMGERTCRMLHDAIAPAVKLRVITRFYREDFIQGVSSLDGLGHLLKSGADIYALKHLHTKLYVFDDTHAIITSANFTMGGLVGNIELGVLFHNEADIIQRAHLYYDDLMAQIQHYDATHQYISKISAEMISAEKDIVLRLLQNRTNKTINMNTTKYGADLKLERTDKLESALMAQESYTGRDGIWLKFEADSRHRISNTVRYFPEGRSTKRDDLTFFPVRPTSLKSGHKLFIAVVSYDRAGNPTAIIVGRAKTKGFNEKNIAKPTDPFYKEWMEDYPYYVEIYDIEAFDAPISEGISILSLYQQVKHRTFPTTISNGFMPIEELKHYHQRRDKIRITEYAERYLDDELDQRISRFGKVVF